MVPSRTLLSLLALATLPVLPGCDGIDTEPGPDLDIVTLEARAGDRRVRDWDFGETGVFLETPALGLTISNESRATSGRIDVTLLGPDAGHFVATGDCRDVFLVPRATCSLRVRFQPTTAGVRHAMVRVAEDDGAYVEIALTGTGTGTGSDPMLTVDPAAIDFGTIATGDNADEEEDVRAIAVRNAAARDITDLAVAVTGSSFSLVPGGCGPTLRAYETCIVQVRLTPAALGPVTGALEVRGGGRMNSATLAGVGAFHVSISSWSGGAGGHGLVTSDPAGIEYDITCGASPGRCPHESRALFTGPVLITAAPASGSRFGGWTEGPCAGSEAIECAIAAGLEPARLGGSWLAIPPPTEPDPTEPDPTEPDPPAPAADPAH